MGGASINWASTGYGRCCLLNFCIHLFGDCIMQKQYTITLAPNPSVMTGPGTNPIILGGGVHGALVIDPAVDDSAFLDAVVQAGAERGGIGRILITHGHPDHIGGTVALRDRLGVYIYAFSRQGVPVADEEITSGTIFPAGEDTLQ